MSLTSKASIARTGTQSLRATVPEGIVAFLGLQVGDKLEWKMEIMNGERTALVRKAKNKEEESQETHEIAVKYAKSKKGRKSER